MTDWTHTFDTDYRNLSKWLKTSNRSIDVLNNLLAKISTVTSIKNLPKKRRAKKCSDEEKMRWFGQCIYLLIKKGAKIDITTCTDFTFGIVCTNMFLVWSGMPRGANDRYLGLDSISYGRNYRYKSLEDFFSRSCSREFNSEKSIPVVNITSIMGANWFEMIFFLEKLSYEGQCGLISNYNPSQLTNYILAKSCVGKKEKIFDSVLLRPGVSFGTNNLVFHDYYLHGDNSDRWKPCLRIKDNDIVMPIKDKISIYHFLYDRLFHRLWLIQQFCPPDLITDVLHYICSFYLKLLIN